MPYIITPRWARIVQRFLFSCRYLLLGAAGTVAAFQPGFTYHLIGATLIIGSWIALIGVATGRFHLELIPIWFLLAALAWASGILFTAGRPTSGVLVLALVPALAERLLHLLLVASRARRVPAEGDSHGAE